MAENTGLQVNQSHIDGSGFMSDINNRKNWLQNSLLQKKPSITNSQDFATIFWAANPANDPNFVVVDGRCYHSAPTESWDPRTRNYSYNIEWTYERANNI
jgi:hypothetical protein